VGISPEVLTNSWLSVLFDIPNEREGNREYKLYEEWEISTLALKKFTVRRTIARAIHDMTKKPKMKQWRSVNSSLRGFGLRQNRSKFHKP
jgi:hypothetical protein